MKKPYIPEGCDQQGRVHSNANDLWMEVEEMEQQIEREQKLLLRIIVVSILIVIAVTLPYHFLIA